MSAVPASAVDMEASLALGFPVGRWPGHRPYGSPTALEALAREIAALHDLSVKDLKSDNRTRDFAHARQHFMAEAYATERYSLPRIGAFLGGRDHTTVLHGIRAHAARSKAPERITHNSAVFCEKPKMSPPGQPILRLASSV